MERALLESISTGWKTLMATRPIEAQIHLFLLMVPGLHLFLRRQNVMSHQA